MKVTVLIPSWNSANYIARAIRSILATNYQDLEVLVMDNESTDDTQAVIAKFNDKRIKCVVKKDRGMYEALNNGIAMAQGEIVCWLGADDQMGERAIQKAVPIFADPDVQWVAGEGTFLFEGANQSRTTAHRLESNISIQRIVRGNLFMSSSIFFRRSFFQQVGGFNDKYKLAADYDLWIRFAHECEPYVLHEPLCIFSYNGNNASSKSKLAMYAETLHILRSTHYKGIRLEKYINIVRMHAYRTYNRVKSALA